MIAMALVNNPSLLIADEPTTALDVTVQAQILDLIDEVKKDFDIGVDPRHARPRRRLGDGGDRARHVRRPRRASTGRRGSSSAAPQHPYTWGLLGSMPTIEARLEQLVSIEGAPPSLVNPPSGCAFHPRCRYRFEPCPVDRPELLPLEGGHRRRVPPLAGREAAEWARLRCGADGGRGMSTSRPSRSSRSST